MGILRTDKISGLETPTAVTGSVVFDGTNDDLQIADSNDFTFAKNDFTIEFWRYKQATAVDTYVGKYGSGNSTRTFWFGQGSNGAEQFYWYSGSSSYSLDSGGAFPINTWAHLAAVRYNGTMTLYVDGVEVASTTSNVDVSLNDTTEILRVGGENTGTYDYQGYISNLRILNGTALYTSNFTPPVHELEVIGDTVLLCCNNPDSAGAEGTGKSITVNNDAAASTFSPGLTRDFTGGTEFSGVTVFDTQGYFVPPSGTTEQRGRGRGLIRMADNAINYITISSLGNSQDFGDATAAAQNTSACASSTRGLFSQGYDHPGYYKTIDYVTIATTGNAQDFGDITTSASFIYGMGGCASSTRGLFGGGFTAPSPNAAAGLKQINYVTIASLGDSQDFGDLTGNGVRYPAATSSPTRGLFAGGRDSADAPVYNQNDIHYVTIATLGNALDFGDLSYTPYSAMGTGSSTRGIFTGGYNSAGNAAYDNIEYVTIASTGNAQDFGNLTVGRGGIAASSNSTRATFAGGNSIPAATNHIDYITIASTGDALNFGDLMSTMSAGCGCSDSHGGLS